MAPVAIAGEEELAPATAEERTPPKVAAPPRVAAELPSGADLADFAALDGAGKQATRERLAAFERQRAAADAVPVYRQADSAAP
jgi:hypothetical protein